MVDSFKRFVHKNSSCAWLLFIWRRWLTVVHSVSNWRSQRHARRWQLKVDGFVQNLKGLNRPLRVAFFVYNDAVFQLESVFQIMVSDPFFDPFIVVITGINKKGTAIYDDENKVHQRTFANLRKKYGERVFDSFDGANVIDFSDKCDLCTSMHGYEGYVHKFCRLSYMTQKGIPSFFVDYGAPVGTVWADHYLRQSTFGYLWRFYVGSKDGVDIFRGRQDLLLSKGRIVASGYPKFDLFHSVQESRRDRKRIIIAPHHTIVEEEQFNLSNFVRFSDLILLLPELYPQIDWVFRPHPTLLPKLVSTGFWTEEKVRNFMFNLKMFKNVEVQIGGDYYETFVNSDALIQDCCSFISEYHMTGHPQCFVLKYPGFEKTQFLESGLHLLDQTYKAYSREDILNFIDEVVVRENDVKKDERNAFVTRILKLNYPHISRFIVDDIKRGLMTP